MDTFRVIANLATACASWPWTMQRKFQSQKLRAGAIVDLLAAAPIPYHTVYGSEISVRDCEMRWRAPCAGDWMIEMRDGGGER